MDFEKHFESWLNESLAQKIPILKSKKGIGIGFVDGDLEIIWKP